MNKDSWGELLPVEGATQVTRSMWEMLNARPYTRMHEKKELNIEEKRVKGRSMRVSPYALHSIKLSDYFNNAEQMVSENVTDKVISLPSINEYSFSNTQLDSDIRSGYPDTCGIEASSLVESCAVKGVAAIAVNNGFDSATSSAIRVLSDVTLQYMDSFCTSLRHTMDNEALTGRTGFYDCVDQVFHDMNVINLRELLEFYNKNVVCPHKKLLGKSVKIEKRLQTLKEKPRSRYVVQQDTPSQSSWAPVPALEEQQNLSQNARWKPFVKTS